MRKLVIFTLVTSLCGAVVAAPLPKNSFFDDSRVHEIRITFENLSWYDQLYISHDSDPNDPYFRATVKLDDVTRTPVGIRFKGDASFYTNTVKKPFKIDFNVFDNGLDFLGLKKLNLNNSFNDPSMLREKMFLDFAAKYVPTTRAVHARVYINGVYWGLYLAVEQIDKDFAQSRFGTDEDGNLYEAVGSDAGGGQEGQHGSDLTWLGPGPAAYHPLYALVTNETANDYSGLVHMIDILNNSPIAELPAAIEPLLDVENALYGVALNNLFVNLDSYNGTAANYYLYDRDDTGQFVHIHWATDHAFARSKVYLAPTQDPLLLDPLWLPVVKEDQPPQRRPLMERLWAVDGYKQNYLRMLARMLREGFDPNAMGQRINRLADLIRSDVYADTNKVYSDVDFEKNLTDDVSDGGRTIHGLLGFVDRRAPYLDLALDGFALKSDLRINEVMTVNTTGPTDQAGERDSWLEITNLGPGKVNLAGVYLTDDANKPTKWALPAIDVNDGRFLVIWLDGEPGEGASHASFTVKNGTGRLYLYGAGAVLIDSVTFAALGANQAWGRFPDGTGQWKVMDSPTPGTANKWTYQPPHLYINELMADNKKTLADERGAYDDWIEIYNGEDAEVDLAGMYLTDDANNPGKWWEIPRGVHIPAHGYVLFWADNDPNDGNTHATFKLGKDGETVALFESDQHGNVLIDKVTFGPQSVDVSYYRRGDGGTQWRFNTRPTPGRANPK